MATVAVTGASGYLGRILLERLALQPSISRVVGIDVAEPAFTTRNLEFYRMDVRSPQFAAAIGGCDAVVHLAAVSGSDADDVRDVNIGGTRSVADAAARMDVRKLIFASSHAVYGAHPDNDYPLTENSPVRPGHHDPYAVSKAEAEGVVRYYSDAHPETVLTVLRLGWVCGPTIPTRNAFVVDAKFRFVIRGYEPAMQALHEDDAADALAFAVTHDIGGVFNVAPAGAVDRPEEILGQRRVTLDLDRAKRVLDRTARLGISVPASDVGNLMYPQVMSAERLLAAGFEPAHSAEEALRAAAVARKDWVAVGKMRFRPRRVALVGGTLGAVLLTGAAKGRRSRRAKERNAPSHLAD
jgi:nucleoside-diphosphate-sugar epimerase